jgi:exodeoxyribonuclease V gamma subunit
MFKKYVSNKIEKLAELFSNHIGGVGDVFAEDIVVVQSLGMSRWLNLKLADVAAQHIVANVNYFLPRNYIFKILYSLQLLPDVDYMSREYSRWNIYSILPEYAQNSVICEYLKEPGADLKRWQLASKIAELFDHYLMYRYHPGTGMEDLWRTESASAVWQQKMFEQVKGDCSTVVEVLNNFSADDHMDELRKLLPKSLSLFSISNMPPIFLKFFYELSSIVDVNLFYLSPAEGFWGDIVEKRKQYAHEIDMDQYWESTNDFLSLNCRLGQEFFLILQDFEGEANDLSEDHFEPIEEEPTTLLHSFQNDLLYMEETFFETNQACDSIVFASCHSEVRELQILYDYLLNILNDNPDLHPSDILVMMPQIEKYAPYINAVFGHPEMEKLKLPFCLSDSNKAMSNDLAAYLVKILDLAKGKASAVDVMDLLENEDIAEKFYIYDSDKDFLSQIILDTNLAWGIDKNFVQELCDVSFANNNWQDCIDRWLTGYAINQESYIADNDILPYDIEGSSEAILLGRFVAFLKKVFETITFLRTCGELSAAEWSSCLLTLVESFFARNYDKAEYRNQVIQAIVNIELETEQVNFHSKLSLSVIRDIVYNSVHSETTYAGFLQRGITFCKLLPMRSIPAKVICLLGINDGVFPRTDSFTDFDLMKFDRQVGERSARYEDRYLFLETILAVREKLYLSYIGQDVVTNEKKSPSIVVSELMDALKEKTGNNGKICLKEHKIQPFNKKYFSDSDLNRSFSKKNLNVALSNLRENINISLPGLAELGVSNVEIPEVIQIRSFVNFFQHPIKEFLKFSFNIAYRENDVEEFREDEPLEIEFGLEAWKLKSQTFEIMQKYKFLTENELFSIAYNILSKEGALPVGEKGVKDFKKSIFTDTYNLFNIFNDKIKGCTCEDLNVDICESLFAIKGNLIIYKMDNEYRYVNYSFSKCKPKNEIIFRIEHLIASVAVNCPGIMIFQDKVLELDMIEKKDALERLQNLSLIYKQGLEIPLAFYPKISFKLYQQSKSNIADQKLYDSLQSFWKTDNFLDYKDIDDLMFFNYFGESAPKWDSVLFSKMKNNALEIFDNLC